MDSGERILLLAEIAEVVGRRFGSEQNFTPEALLSLLHGVTPQEAHLAVYGIDDEGD